MAYERRDFSQTAADTALTSGISNVDTTWTIDSTTGWPTGGANGPFFVMVDYDVAGRELALVTSRTGNSLQNVVRGQGGTSAASHSAGAKIRHIHTERDSDEANYAVSQTVGQITTKGDLLAGTAANTLGRRSVGTNDQVLIADSAQATGMRWGLLGAGSLDVDSVGSSELANNAVDTNAIANLAVTGAKMANDTVTATQIAADAVTASELADNAVDTNSIVNLAVTAGKIANNAVANGAALLGTDQHLVLVQAANPGAIGARRLWVNTTAGKRALLQRNSGNTAWEVLEAYDWVAYTPTYPGMAAVGNAVHFARYIRKGGVVIVNSFFYIGTTTSFAGLTNLAVALPTNAQAKDLDSFVGYPGVGQAEFFGHAASRATTAGGFFGAVGLVVNAGAAKGLDRMNFFTTAGASGAWSQTQPVSWAAGDRFSCFAEYEPATLEDANWV